MRTKYHMRKEFRVSTKCCVYGILTAVMILVIGRKALAFSFDSNPYITYSPDGGAWTVREALPKPGDAQNRTDPSCWYPYGECFETGIQVEQVVPQTGEHYYQYDRTGKVSVAKWEVVHRPARCIHNESKAFHGIVPQSGRCLSSYYSGWRAYCADCGEPINEGFIYMSRMAVRSFSELDLDKDYYYICPTCGHLEQGRSIRHSCKAVSANRYRVVYLRNGSGVAGNMQSSFHMYNDADSFEGESTAAAQRLNLNTYSRQGYLFAGWNTAPDGSGESFSDGQRILNLTDENYEEESGRGTVVLYAQWKKTTGFLEIDPNRGRYKGSEKTVVLSVEYGKEFDLRSDLVTAPAGWRIRFDTQGGAALEPLHTQNEFTGWETISLENGSLSADHYVFYGEDGRCDRIRALYHAKPVKLPMPVKSGYSFAGWYEDKAMTKYVGAAGSSYVATRDVTLYACWAELVLSASPDPLANNGRGGVDLSWRQPDGRAKRYLLYQKREGAVFEQLGEGGAPENAGRTEVYLYTGDWQEYPVRQSGFYELEAYGAQGQDWEGYHGGYGGGVKGTFYLEKGEVIRILIGGQNSFGGGGKADFYGAGGGRTVILSSIRGALLIGGGGGGASPGGPGGNGGLSVGLRNQNAVGSGQESDGRVAGIQKGQESDGRQAGIQKGQENYGRQGVTDEMQDSGDIWEGEAGASGGGAGAVGGSAGVRQVHVHTAACLHRHVGNESEGGDCYRKVIREKTCEVTVSGPYIDWGRTNDCTECLAAGRGGFGTMHPRCWRITHSSCGIETDWGGNGWWECEICHTIGFRWGSGQNRPYGYEHSFRQTAYELNCNRVYDCGNPVDVITSAYGGSSYIAEALATAYEYKPGVKENDGRIVIRPVQTGFTESTGLTGVYAPDLAGPEKIDPDSAGLEDDAKGNLVVSFREPEDRGTTYYHKAESYLAGQSEILSVSNITRTEVITGVKGYYYCVDSRLGTVVSSVNADNAALMLTESMLVVPKTKESGSLKHYLHIAAVDYAGNIGKTLTLELSSDSVRVQRTLSTNPVGISSVVGGRDRKSVAHAGENVYYVRADGRTPFVLEFGGSMEESRPTSAEPDELWLNIGLSERALSGIFAFCVPKIGKDSPERSFPAGELGRRVSGEGILNAALYGEVIKGFGGKTVKASQSFTISAIYEGFRVQVYPALVMKDSGAELVSSPAADLANGIVLIGDATPPLIYGTEPLENSGADRTGLYLDLTARDEMSGVSDFKAVLLNTDNDWERICLPDEDGHIRIRYEEDLPLFSGALRLTIYASDRVGNETVLEYSMEDFGVSAEIIRMLEPHTTSLKRGETGILKIRAWGYPEKLEIEYPEFLMAGEDNLPTHYVYEIPPEEVSVEIPFMVPLEGVEDGEYLIAVRAWKNGGMAEAQPAFAVFCVEDTVLGELRTKLR